MALAGRIMAGDRSALRVLIDRESGPLLRACSRVLGDADDAADVVQETLIAALDALPGYRGDGGLHQWLMRIAVRRALRRKASSPPTGDVEALQVGDVERREPDALVLAGERDRILREAVAALPEPYREVITLRYFGELSPTEIALATGVPPETVRTRLKRGLERLRRDIGGEVAA